MPVTPRKRKATKRLYSEDKDTVDISDEEFVDNAEEDDHEDVYTPSKTRPKRSTPSKTKSPRTPLRSNGSTRNGSSRKVSNKLAIDNNNFDIDQEDQSLVDQIISESKPSGKVSPALKLQRVSESGENIFGTDESTAALFLTGSEGYFDQHKVREKISMTPFSKAPEISYDQFVNYIQQAKDRHKQPREFLASLYRTMFTQWLFELHQGFSLVFYGVGSKRKLLTEFVSSSIRSDIPVLVINGYNPATNLKEILNAVVSVLVKDSSVRSRLPKNPPDLLNALLKYLDEVPKRSDKKADLILLIHNIDGDALRSDKNQVLVSRLASVKQIWLVTSIDHVMAPLLWDAAKLSMYNFIWHDLTTYELYTVETSFDDPLALSGSKSATGSRGVKFVLSSLTVNARTLYRLLLCHQLEIMTEQLPDDNNIIGTAGHGIEFKAFYQKCVEEFVVSNELNFKTMLVEFYEHKMAVSSKDSSGVERIYIPQTRPALETTLEELMEM